MAPDDELTADGAGPRRPAPDRTIRERVEHLADATGTTPGRILLGGVAVASALAVFGWTTRAPAPPVETSLPFASSTAVPAPTSTSEPGVVVVHVAGAVLDPGVHELPAGSRVVDAVEVAGGLAPTADGARLNLAAPLVDGQRVYVPRMGEVVPVDVGGPAAGVGGAPAGPLDLNQADEAALEGLPGVGPATAAAIIEHRSRIGRFSSVDQLLDVPGIGEAKLESLRDLVTV